LNISNKTNAVVSTRVGGGIGGSQREFFFKKTPPKAAEGERARKKNKNTPHREGWPGKQKGEHKGGGNQARWGDFLLFFLGGQKESPGKKRGGGWGGREKGKNKK